MSNSGKHDWTKNAVFLGSQLPGTYPMRLTVLLIEYKNTGSYFNEKYYQDKVVCFWNLLVTCYGNTFNRFCAFTE